MKNEQFNNFINLTLDKTGGMTPNNIRVYDKYGFKGGSCVELDKKIKDIRDGAVAERLKPDADQSYIQSLVDYKANLEMSFAMNSCADKIETLRQKETGVLITKTSIDQEKKVLGNSKKQENIYIGVGAVVLLVGLIIVLKK
jgi:hypothetical protein